MIGKHITEQPLYTTLKQYRIITIVSMIFIGYLMSIAWFFYTENHETMSKEGVAGFFGYIVTLLGAFKFCLTNIQARHEE